MKEKEILAYLIRVDEETGTNYRGSFEMIPNELDFKQRFVNFGRAGGLIQVINISGVDVICHDESKLLQFPPSRAWVEGDTVLDVFCGNLICVRADLSIGEFTSIRREDLKIIQKYLKPIYKISGNRGIAVPDESWLEEWKNNDKVR